MSFQIRTVPMRWNHIVKDWTRSSSLSKDFSQDFHWLMSIVHSFVHSYSFIRAFFHSPTSQIIHPFTQSFKTACHTFTHSIQLPLIPSCNHLFIHSLIHSLIHHHHHHRRRRRRRRHHHLSTQRNTTSATHSPVSGTQLFMHVSISTELRGTQEFSWGSEPSLSSNQLGSYFLLRASKNYIGVKMRNFDMFLLPGIHHPFWRS